MLRVEGRERPGAVVMRMLIVVAIVAGWGWRFLGWLWWKSSGDDIVRMCVRRCEMCSRVRGCKRLFSMQIVACGCKDEKEVLYWKKPP